MLRVRDRKAGVNTWDGPLANTANEIAESLWHTAEGKRCGNCLAPFNRARVPKALFGATYFFPNGRSHRMMRLLCAECHRTIRSKGPSATLQEAAALEVAGELLVPGVLGEAHEGD